MMGSDTEDILGNEAESWEECLELERNNIDINAVATGIIEPDRRPKRVSGSDL